MSKGVVRVARVTSCTVTADRSVFEAAIDLPIQGMAVNIEEFTISGWIIEQSEGLRALRVEDLSGSQNVPVARFCREDLARSGKENNFGFTISLNLKPHFPSKVSILGSFGRRPEQFQLFEISVDYLNLPVVSARTPLLVTSMGRSGTSYLMGLLAAHPAIATPRVFPFEERIASYYGDVFRAITRTGAAKAGLPHYFGAAHRSYPSNDLLKPGLLRRIDQNGRFEVTSGLIAQSANAARTLVDVIYSGFTGTTLEQTPIFAEKMIGYFSTQEI